MPDIRHTKLQFMQKLLTGEKMKLKQADTVISVPPRWPELSAKALMPDLVLSKEISAYLPDWK